MKKQKTEIERVTLLLADISKVLISSGSNTRRSQRNVERIANALGYHSEIFHSYSGVILSVTHKETEETKSLVLTIKHHGVNFNAVSAISILSWLVVEKNLPIKEIEKELEIIKKRPHYSALITWFFVAIAGGSLAYIFGGKEANYIEFGISFLATYIGLAARKILQVRNFNHFICWGWAAFVSVTVVNIFRFFGIDHSQNFLGDFFRYMEISHINNALAACVLWLIPGVPLINSFIDLLTGNIVSGLAKGTTGSILILMIALGFFTSLKLFGYELT